MTTALFSFYKITVFFEIIAIMDIELCSYTILAAVLINILHEFSLNLFYFVFEYEDLTEHRFLEQTTRLPLTPTNGAVSGD